MATCTLPLLTGPLALVHGRPAQSMSAYQYFLLFQRIAYPSLLHWSCRHCRLCTSKLCLSLSCLIFDLPGQVQLSGRTLSCLGVTSSLHWILVSCKFWQTGHSKKADACHVHAFVSRHLGLQNKCSPLRLGLQICPPKHLLPQCWGQHACLCLLQLPAWPEIFLNAGGHQ